MVVFDPIKVVITNLAADDEIWLETENNPEDENAGTRNFIFTREIFIEKEDFMENPPKKFFRLAPGQKVRLKSAYIIQCDEVIKDAAGEVSELHCSFFPESKSGSDTTGLKVQGTLHWVSTKYAIPIEAREYDRLFKVENPGSEEGDFKDYLNPESLHVISTAWAEPGLADANEGEHFQFLRKGYYYPDLDSTKEKPVFNRVVTLKDAWAKIVQS